MISLFSIQINQENVESLKETERKFVELVDKHQNLIHKVCRMYVDHKSDHNDLFQEVVLQLWKAYPSFKGRAKITTWMYRVALYTAMSDFKKRRKTRLLRTYELPSDATRNEAESAYELEHLHAAIHQLNAAERGMLTLYLDERSYQEISEIIGITETNVGVRLNRIKKKLRTIMNVS